MSEQPAEARTYDIAQVLNALPHHYPLLLVDRVRRTLASALELLGIDAPDVM